MFPNQFYTPNNTIMPINKKSINWSSLLNNTQKTLNIVNQAIPIVYQVKPIINNARTMFKVASEFTKASSNKINKNYSVNNSVNNDEGPSFFI